MKYGLILWYVLALVLIGLHSASADTIFDLDEVSIKYRRFHPSARHPLFYASTPKEGLDLRVNTTILNYVYWNNTVHSYTNSAQYYLVGWELQFGVRLTQWADFFYEHHSQHLLDHTYPHSKFPVEDSWGFTLYLYGGKKRGESIIP